MKITFSLGRLERGYYEFHGHRLPVYCNPDRLYC